MFTFTTYTPIFSQKTSKIGTKSGQFGQKSENYEFTLKIGATNNPAYNPEGNSEAESRVRKIKHAIAHAGDKLESLNSIVANLNTDQRTDGSGSAAEFFLQRTLRVPGLGYIL